MTTTRSWSTPHEKADDPDAAPHVTNEETRATRETRAPRWARAMEFLARYHKSEVIGAHRIPKQGGAVVAGTHSLASYEIFILCHFSEKVLGRRAQLVGDDLMFKIPGLRATLADIGFVSGGREQTIERLKAGALLGIAPGGMKESLRGSSRKYRYDWSGRRGFAWAAMKAGVPVVPCACPNADDIYTVHENPLTTLIYETLRVPVPIFHGRWLTAVPRPVKLIHALGEPIHPDVAPDQVTEADVVRFHTRITAAVDALVVEAREWRSTSSSDHDVIRLGWS